MTLLRGSFAMVLLVRTDASRPDVESALAEVASDGRLTVDVREVPPPEPASTEPAAGYVLSVHGADRPGIVSALTAEVAAGGGNVTDLTTRLAGDLYVLVAEVQLPTRPGSPDVGELAERISRTAESLGVEASLRPLETDEL
jgi:glycine cleavage system transcriptional repressor